ncbi:MAG: glycine cleavage system protein R [Verrucomicrobiales bacterium]|nr:glycine cleavage system protein R [Verrucomicrobiales bacterium]
MNVVLVLTVIGRDRPGLVERLAALVADQGGNWLESRMSRLGGEFAGILRLTAPVANESKLIADLAGLQSVGLTVLVRRDELPASTPQTGRLVNLDLVGQDRPGIVRQIAAALAARGANVEELSTECVSAPMSGEPLFKARARLALPAHCDLAQIRIAVEAIAADLLVDVSLAPVAPET